MPFAYMQHSYEVADRRTAIAILLARVISDDMGIRDSRTWKLHDIAFVHFTTDKPTETNCLE